MRDDKRKPSPRITSPPQRVGRQPHLRALRAPKRGVYGGRRPAAGRWSLLRHPSAASIDRGEVVNACVLRLLRRWGVVFRETCARERLAFPWRVLLHELRRLEAAGEVRGGRFVDGIAGEQFALPTAVEALRRVRRERDGEEIVVVSAADPLNLTGIVTPGERLSPFSVQVIAYRDGLPVEIGELGAVRSRLQPGRA
jgi:ATP-dependent Lhr-like helicase